jgi:signal transduction histidine kinase
MSAKPPPETGPARKLSLNGVVSALASFVTRLDYPEDASLDPERIRQARLISRFGLLGSFFGCIYALFYLLIGHRWGVLIIVVCSACFALAPIWLRRTKSIETIGHFLTSVLTLGFTALCFVEGGLQGHAIAWLVSVPLCALLLLGQKAATPWAMFALLAAGLVASLDLMGIQLPIKYDLKWNPIVSTAGYLGLIAFMFLLGMIFEKGRTRALSKMQDALRKLSAANEELVHLNKEKNEFLGMAAHDLKNPLTVILGCTEVAGLPDEHDNIPQLLEHITGAATRMRNLITDLLDVNAIEQGKFASKIVPCDIRALVEQSVENIRPAAARKSIEIRLGVSDGLWANADPAATLQILDNLLSNALKYSPPNTTTHVHTLPEADYILVSVRDEGPGISEADQKKMFQKYTRLSARPTGGESSTGLGLAIVKRLAEAMSGSIQCHSVPGAGATFTLRLPIGSAPAKIGKPGWPDRTGLKSQVN